METYTVKGRVYEIEYERLGDQRYWYVVSPDGEGMGHADSMAGARKEAQQCCRQLRDEAVKAELADKRWFSFGGGVDSVAVLVLSAQGMLPYTDFVFSNVGFDSEGQETFDYLERHVKPFAAQHGLIIHEIAKTGKYATLYQQVTSEKNFIGLPMYSLETGRPLQRACTTEWKLDVVRQFMRRQGYNSTTIRTTMGIGFAAEEAFRAKRMIQGDEKARAKGTPRHAEYEVEFPLIELGLDRSACQRIILEAGLPECPRSACWWCPYRHMDYWQKVHDTDPDLWARIVAFEARVLQKCEQSGTMPMYLTAALVPIERAIRGERRLSLRAQEKQQKVA